MVKSSLRGSFASFLRYQSRTSNRVMKDVANSSLKGMRYSIVAATPRKTGKLQRSMKKSKAVHRADGIPGYEGEVYTTVNYAWIVNQGRRRREVHARPGHHFVIGGKKRTHYTQSAMAGRHMFERGAFEFSAVQAEPLMVLKYEEWIHEALIRTGQGV